MTTKTASPGAVPYQATHPGILIADELEARDDLNQKELAHLLGVSSTFLNEIIKGKRPVTADTALVLEKALGIPADFWLKFQVQHDLDLARIKEKNVKKVQNIEVWSIIKNYVPVNMFKKLGYLSDDIEKNIQQIFTIFKVQSVDDLINQFAERKFSFYRKSEKLTVDEKNLFSWSALAEYEASLVEVKNFNNDNQQSLIDELNQCFLENHNIKQRMKSVLADHGIKLIFLEKFTKTPVDGYSFWSNKNPAIVLTCRYNRLDNLAFTLFHELGHVFLHLSENRDLKFLDLDDKVVTVYEEEADGFAKNNLIDAAVWKEFKNYEFPFSDKVILQLANTHNIHPAIILGRMCFENNTYKVFSGIDRAIK
ncbi:MAG: addiction module antidote protein, HigA family [Chryseobacterium sp. SCN 40-13]|nr:MAG: addiction module antidote protein, HigA family [Chryseobacterium sp. SCN 40-13]